MSMMLVAYDKCGCRISALLDVSDAEGARAFRADLIGYEIREEEHESIAAHFCSEHEPTVLT
jgi:hypothetical protein